MRAIRYLRGRTESANRQIADEIRLAADGRDIGEHLATAVFRIRLNDNRTVGCAAGVFTPDSPGGLSSLAGKSVSILLSEKQELALKTFTTTEDPDYYLILIGPRLSLGNSNTQPGPLVIESVHLFASAQLRPETPATGSQTGLATKDSNVPWGAARVWPDCAIDSLDLGIATCRLLSILSKPGTAR